MDQSFRIPAVHWVWYIPLNIFAFVGLSSLETFFYPSRDLSVILGGLVGETSTAAYAVMPGQITIIGSSLVLVILTALLLKIGIKNKKNLPLGFLHYFFSYNSLIIFLKFTLAVFAIYSVVLTRDVSLFVIGAHSIIGMVLMLYFIYAVVFSLISSKFKKCLESHLTEAERKSLSLLRLWPHIRGSTVFLVIVLFLYTGGMFSTLLFLFGGVGAVQYASLLFFSEYSVLVLIVIVLVIVLCCKTFQAATTYVQDTRQGNLFIATYATGMSFITAFHVLWFFYFIILNSYWPLVVLDPFIFPLLF